MLFMVIEHFKNRDAVAIYRRVRERGRLMPEGLKYLGSWVEEDFGRCFQVVECDDPRLLEQWTNNWKDLVEFEIVPVLTSQQAADAVAPLLLDAL